MLMLMRSDDSTPSICEDTDVKVICAVEAAAEEYKDCPVACRAAAEEDNAEEDAVVKSGDLAVKSSAAADRKVVVSSIGKAVSDLDTLTFRTSEEVTLNKVVLEKYGYASGTNLVSAVWLEDENGSVISNTGTVNAKGLVTLTLKKDYKNIDGTLNATIVLETNQSATIGWTIGFKVKDVTSSAANVDLGDYKAYTYDVVAYDGTKAEVTGKGWDKSYNYAAGESYEVAKFKIKAPQDSSIVVRGFTLENAWWTLTASQRLDINKFFDKVTVKVDWKEVKATATTDKNGELTVSFKNEVELSARQSVEVIVLASLNDDFDEYGKAIHFTMLSSGLSASDKNDARISVNVSAAFIEYVFNGGKVKLTNNKLGNIDSALNSVDVKIAEWTITVSEAVEWTVTVSTTSTTTWSNPIYTWVNAIESIRLVIGNDEFDGSISNTGLITFSNVEIAESGKVKILVDLKEDVEYEKLSVSFGPLQWNLVYSENTSSTAETNGAITVSKLNFTAPTGALKNSLTSKNDAEFRNNDYTTLVVFDGTYTAKKQDIELKEFSIVGNNLPLNKSDVKFYVTVGDAEWEDDFVNGTTTGVAEGDLSDAVLVKVGESVKVKVEAAVDAYEYETVAAATAASATCTSTDGTNCDFPISLWSFTLTLKGEDMNGNEAWEASRKTVNLSIVKVGSVEIEATTAKTVLRKAADQPLAAVTVRPDWSSEATIEQVVVTLTGRNLETTAWSYDADQLFALYVDDNAVDFTPTTAIANTAFNGTTSITLTAEWLNFVAKSAWVEVKLEILEELAADITVSSIQINQTTSNKEFRRLLLPAVVKIANQSDDGLATTLTLWVEKSTSDHVYNVAISTGTAPAAAADWKVLNGGDEVTNWVTDEVLNGTASYYITALRYCTTASCSCDDSTDSTNNTAGCVIILKSDFNDFFRVGSTYARINKARDN